MENKRVAALIPWRWPRNDALKTRKRLEISRNLGIILLNATLKCFEDFVWRSLNVCVPKRKGLFTVINDFVKKSELFQERIRTKKSEFEGSFEILEESELILINTRLWALLTRSSWCLVIFFISNSASMTILSVIWQKGKSQNDGYKNTKHAKLSE